MLSRLKFSAAFFFFALIELISQLIPALQVSLSFLSPIQAVTSLVLLMTGQPDAVDSLVAVLLLRAHGWWGIVFSSLVSGTLGTMLLITTLVVFEYTETSSPRGAKLFRATFIPLWLTLISYHAALQAWPAFARQASTFENLELDYRRSAGFGILLLALITPMLLFLGAKLYDLVFHPEKHFRSDI